MPTCVNGHTSSVITKHLWQLKLFLTENATKKEAHILCRVHVPREFLRLLKLIGTSGPIAGGGEAGALS
jgi:hypothetical protein